MAIVTAGLESLMSFEAVKQRLWNEGSLIEKQIPLYTMLTLEEQRMLTWFAKDFHTGHGQIVDAGCFVGGSTVSLARGFRFGDSQKIQTFDVFRAGWHEASVLNREIGSSFRDLFEENIAEFRTYVEVHEGDILQFFWPDIPIEILFIDCAKSAEVNDHLLRSFFPNLVPNQSVVIQQDYIWVSLPWIHLSMEKLRDHFEWLADLSVNSVVFGLTKPLTQEDIESATWGALSRAERVDLMSRVVGRMHGYKRDFMLQVQAHMSRLHEDEDRMGAAGLGET